MNARIRTLGVLMVLFGVAFLITSCSDEDNGSTPAPEPQWQAAQSLLQAMAVDSGAVVSFIGPVMSGSALMSVTGTPEPVDIQVPLSEGNSGIYLFFVNDHPDQRYEHQVRYAWLSTGTGHSGHVNATWWPRAVLWPVPGPSPAAFSLIETRQMAGVIFYYGHEGEAEFPPAYLP